MKVNDFKKIMVIVNPNAGKGCKAPGFLRKLLGFRHGNTENISTAQIIEKILLSFLEYELVPEIFTSSAPGDAEKEARRCVQRNYDALIAVGGDGTVNEVINGIAGTNTALGVIPFGTANVFAAQNNLPSDIAGACKVVMSGKIIRLDLGCINGERYFACMAGIGFDAYVIKKADRRMKKIFGMFSYFFAMIFSYFSYKFEDIEFEIDSQPLKKNGKLLFVCNGPYYGGSMLMAPKADPADGLLDICILKKSGIFSLISYVIAIYRGTLHKNKNAEYWQCGKISLCGKTGHPVHADAEYIGVFPAEIKICPGALKTIIP
ncbi:MAG: hypothetical protein A2017_21235 [Lentisphaerae bacterium GWF2_44_16]|nr:MAG: hypothetical protein A2017_21235 [Lentisphaerae bacterium GWF2_44_16]